MLPDASTMNAKSSALQTGEQREYGIEKAEEESEEQDEGKKNEEEENKIEEAEEKKE